MTKGFASYFTETYLVQMTRHQNENGSSFSHLGSVKWPRDSKDIAHKPDPKIKRDQLLNIGNTPTKFKFPGVLHVSGIYEFYKNDLPAAFNFDPKIGIIH